MFKYFIVFTVIFTSNYLFAQKLDPTRPFGHRATVSVTSNDEKMILESIIHAKDTSTVIISGQLLKKFDYIGEYQLTEINEKSVILQSTEERIKLIIFKQNVIKMSITK